MKQHTSSMYNLKENIKSKLKIHDIKEILIKNIELKN
jgi:hypothetical protein